MEKETKKTTAKKTTKSNAKTTAAKKTTKKVAKTVEEPKTEVKKIVEENPIKNTMSDKTRYMIVGIVSVLFLGLIIGLSIISNNNNKENNGNNANTVEVKKEDRDVSTDFLNKFYSVVDSESVQVILFESATCGYCKLQLPIFQNIVKDYEVSYLDIDVSTLSESEASEVINALGLSGATPTTIVVQSGKILDKNEGYMDGKEYIKFLVKNGVLKQGAQYKEEEQLKDINYSDFKKIMSKKGTSAIFIDTTACQDCITSRSTLNVIAKKNNFTISYMSASYLNETEINSFVSEDLKNMDYKEESYVKNGEVNVPLLLIVKDGKISKYALGNKEQSEFEKVFKEAKMIK